MTKRHYHDDQDEADDPIYKLLGSRYTNIAAYEIGKLQRTRRPRRDDSEYRGSAQKPIENRERLKPLRHTYNQGISLID